MSGAAACVFLPGTTVTAVRGRDPAAVPGCKNIHKSLVLQAICRTFPGQGRIKAAEKRLIRDMFEFPEGKRYNSFVGYYRRRFGERLQKLVLDAGFSCPNRDGAVGRGGCTFCDNAAFHPGYSTPGKPLLVQIDEGIEFQRVRYPRARHYLAYFQAYSNTYAPLERLRALYGEVLGHPEVVGIVVGTRPDCVDERKLDYLADLASGLVLPGWSRSLGVPSGEGASSGGGVISEEDVISGPSIRKVEGLSSGGFFEGAGGTITAPIVVVEYGIESCYDGTLRRINRGHDFECARRAVEMTASRGIDTGAHFILGLPGETRDMLLGQCGLISSLPLRSVKFHQLQIVKGTAMEKEYAADPSAFHRPGLEDYLDFVIDILERLRPDLYIERVAGEVPPRFVNDTPWGLVRNFEILRLLDKRLEERDAWQGRLWGRPGKGLTEK